METRTLEPPPYLRHLADCLAEHEPDLWARLNGADRREQAEAGARLALLRDATAWSGFGAEGTDPAAAAAERLGVDLPIVLYRAVTGIEAGARLHYLPGAVHVVLDPDVGGMEQAARTALLGRELARHQLLSREEGRYLALAGLAIELETRLQVDAAHRRTVQRAGIFQELHCDRAGALVAGSPEAVQGLFHRTLDGGDRLRPRALELWWEQGTGAEREVAQLVRGALDLDSLDYVDQVQIAGLTRRWLSLVVQPPWMKTDSVLGHCRQMFPGFAGGPIASDEDVDESLVLAEVRGTLPDLKPYWLSLLLDLGVVDESLGDVALVRAMQVADEAGLREDLITMAREELGLGAQLVQDLWRDRELLLAAKEQGS